MTAFRPSPAPHAPTHKTGGTDPVRLDELAAPTVAVSANNQKITALAGPTVPTDAATKAYVDAIATGLDVKLSVRVATTANITLSGTQTIDGVAVIATNRVLVKNQTTASENGIWVCAAGAWARSTDADTDPEVTAGLFTFVEEGTVNADQGWALATNNPIVVGSTALAFTQVSGVGGGGAPSGAAGGVLSGTYPNPGFAADMATQVELDAHINDTSAAHAASATSFTPVGTIASTDVQAAIAEVAAEAGGGGAASDATLTTSDITTNNVSTTKHGFAPKGDNNRSHYLDGTGSYRNLWSGHDWYVDEFALAGGDGHSPNGAFVSFAAANAACSGRDTIVICSDLTQNCVLDKTAVRVTASGNRVLHAQSSTSYDNYTMNVITTDCIIENLTFYGHAGFRGVHLLFNRYSNGSYAEHVTVNGTGGTGPGWYPTSPGGGNGLGGIGLMYHVSELSKAEDLLFTNCSIAIAQGTWSTRTRITQVTFSQNGQDFVQGLWSGPNAAVAGAGPFAYGQNGRGADEQTGYGTFRNWNSVNCWITGVTPNVDLIGDGTSNCAVSQGNMFEDINFSEGTTGHFRIGSAGNTFINAVLSPPSYWTVEGQRTKMINTQCGSTQLQVYSNFNTFDGMASPTAQTGQINGPGNYNSFKNMDLNSVAGIPLSLPGAGNKFENCRFVAGGGATAITRASVGARPTITSELGTYPITYATSMIPEPEAGLHQYIAVTNGTAFTIANPQDFTNTSNPNNIMVTNPITLDIYNNSGGAMGAITWGSKYVLQGGTFTNPANGKHVLIEFYYNFALDKWIEKNRTLDV